LAQLSLETTPFTRIVFEISKSMAVAWWALIAIWGMKSDIKVRKMTEYFAFIVVPFWQLSSPTI
jgi:hypothetical protein